MIRHVVLFSWTAEATDEQKQRVLAELQTLPPLMTGLRSYHAGPDAGLSEGNFDFAVTADFDDADSYRAYRDHPAHRAVIERAITPIRQDRAAVQVQI
ncbi:MAG TPA: Dabb family protein [Streptosporangiaceae bacterium]|nr:Dabb family protein [Streptosporangiaceae bacterium]